VEINGACGNTREYIHASARNSLSYYELKHTINHGLMKSIQLSEQGKLAKLQ
jgi:hypothetical protein